MLELDHIYNIDCMEGLKQLNNDSVDISIVDPPYGTTKKDQEWGGLNYFLFNIDSWFKEVMRVSKFGVLWFCADKMVPQILKNKEFLFHRMFTWEKPAGSQFNGASNNNIWYSSELILVFMKRDYLLKKGLKSNYSYSVFKERPHKYKDFNHPTVKPLSIILWLIEHYSNKNDIILDPFIGSGTVAVACKQLNRHFIGFEINKDYCKIANKRLEQEYIEGVI